MTRDEAIDRLRQIYHKTRMTPDVPVPADVVHAIVYGGDEITFTAVDASGRKREWIGTLYER